MSEPLMQTYARLPVTFTRGQGALLWDTGGQCYLDALGGIAVCALGHAHPAVTEALQDQAGRLLHTSNLYNIDLQRELAARLCALSGLDRAFFCNSGAEANEAAIKIARRHGHRRGIETPVIVTMENSFHGRTLATLTATGNPKVKEGFGPPVEGFRHLPFGNIDAVEQLARTEPGVCAVLVEPIQGEGGIRVPPEGYLRRLREVCNRHGWLLMVDEIQSGTGRTGRWFAFQHEEILPDVLTLAKALGNGVPIGACLAAGPAAGLLQPGSHGTTFGGNPLAARAALTVIDAIERNGLVSRCEQLGRELLNGFRRRLEGVEGVADIRGLGLMIGIELDRPCTDLVGKALENRLLINVTAGNVVRLLPPYIIDDSQANAILERVSELIRGFLENEAAA